MSRILTSLAIAIALAAGIPVASADTMPVHGVWGSAYSGK